MPGFTDIFGGTTIAPANATYLALVMATDVSLQWPNDQSMSDLVVADTIDVDASAPGLNIDLPDARQASQGYTTMFNNVGAQTVTVRNAQGSTVLSLSPATAWVIYLVDNSTEAGTWRITQLGASVSVANAAALAGAGLKAVGSVLSARLPIEEHNINQTLLDGDRATLQMWTGGVGAFDLPDAAVVGADWFCSIRNSGSGDLTVTPPSGTIDGAASKTYPAGSSSFVVTDGINYFTLGFGSGAGGGGAGFDFLAISVAGSGDYVLSGAELNRVGYRFTGVLTGTRNIVVPGAIAEYWVDNQTTGAFSLFVKTAPQSPGVEVPQNNRKILYCDGTSVVAAESSSVSFPIPVAQGGTGAINAASARTNLGATATGSALFTAADATAALTAISAVPTSRSISASTGLTGGGDLSADRTFQVDFSTVARLVPQVNSQSGNYTLVLTDADKIILHPNGAGSGDTFTIPSNASVAFDVGTMIMFVNRDSNDLSIALNTDTLIWAGTTSTGTRTLGQNGYAVALKTEATTWIIAGVNLT